MYKHPLNMFNELSLKQLNTLISRKRISLPSKEGDELLKKRAIIIDKEDLINLCKEYIKENEIDTLLTESAGESNLKASNLATDASFADCTPEQLLFRAESMRKHPAIVRASDPSMAGLSDEAIFEFADKLKMLAENPQMRSNLSDYLKSLSPDDLANIQRHKSEFTTSSTKPSTVSSVPSSARSASSGGVQLQDLTEAQLDELVQAILSNPQYARNMLRSQSGLGYMSSEQIDKQINMLRSLDKDTMKATIQAAIRMQKLCQPLIVLYNRCDTATSGNAKYIFGVLMLLIGVLIAYCLWHVLNFVVLWLMRLLNVNQINHNTENGEQLDIVYVPDQHDTPVAKSIASPNNPEASGIRRFHGEDEFEF